MNIFHVLSHLLAGVDESPPLLIDPSADPDAIPAAIADRLVTHAPPVGSRELPGWLAAARAIRGKVVHHGI